MLFRSPEIPDELLSALRSHDVTALGRALANDLQPAALRLRPELAAALERGREASAFGAVVSGSGPTVAFLAHNPAAAEGLAKDLRHHSFDAMAVHGPVHGARIISDTLL